MIVLPLAIAVVLIVLLLALGLAFRAARRMTVARPALPIDCGDCVHMIPRAKIYKRETLEESDGLVHYLCEQRWIEVTPNSPWCELGRSKTRTTALAR